MCCSKPVPNPIQSTLQREKPSDSMTGESSTNLGGHQIQSSQAGHFWQSSSQLCEICNEGLLCRGWPERELRLYHIANRNKSHCIICGVLLYLDQLENPLVLFFAFKHFQDFSSRGGRLGRLLQRQTTTLLRSARWKFSTASGERLLDRSFCCRTAFLVVATCVWTN